MIARVVGGRSYPLIRRAQVPAVGIEPPAPLQPRQAKAITTNLGTAMPFFLSDMFFRPNGACIDVEFATVMLISE